MFRTVPIQRAGIVGSPPFAEDAVFPNPLTYDPVLSEPTVASQAQGQVSPDVVAYEALSLAPVLVADANGTVTPNSFAYVAASLAPELIEVSADEIVPGTFAYTADPNAPTVADQGAGAISPDALAYAGLSNVPTLSGDANGVVNPDTLAYAATANGPTVAAGDATIFPDTFAYVSTANAPTLAADANGTVSPDSFAYAAAPNAPTLAADANGSITPDALAYAALSNAPTLAEAAGAIEPDTFAYASVANAPSLAADLNGSVSPLALTYAATANGPTVAADANGSVSPGTFAYVSTANNPTVAEDAGASLEVLRVDTANDGGSGGTSLTLNASAPAGTEYVVIMGVYQFNSQTTTAATFTASVDGASAPQAAQGYGSVNRNQPTYVLFTKRTTDTTAIDYTITCSVSLTALSIGVVYLAGVAGTTDTDAVEDTDESGQIGSGTSDSLSLTPTSSDSIAIGGWAVQGGDAVFTPGTGYDEEADFTSGGTGNFEHSSMIQSQIFDTTGAKTFDASWDQSDGHSGCCVILGGA